MPASGTAWFDERFGDGAGVRVQNNKLERENAIFSRARERPLAIEPDNHAHFRDRRGYVATPWDGDAKFEAEVKARTMATLRCVPLDQSRFRDQAGGRSWALFARSY